MMPGAVLSAFLISALAVLFRLVYAFSLVHGEDTRALLSGSTRLDNAPIGYSNNTDTELHNVLRRNPIRHFLHYKHLLRDMKRKSTHNQRKRVDRKHDQYFDENPRIINIISTIDINSTLVNNSVKNKDNDSVVVKFVDSVNSIQYGKKFKVNRSEEIYDNNFTSKFDDDTKIKIKSKNNAIERHIDNPRRRNHRRLVPLQDDSLFHNRTNVTKFTGTSGNGIANLKSSQFRSETDTTQHFHSLGRNSARKHLGNLQGLGRNPMQKVLPTDQPRHHSENNSRDRAWPHKKVVELDGDFILGGLMMVHERQDDTICGPVMPQGGIQALEAMLYTIDFINNHSDEFISKTSIGALVLDDCDKDTYGLEQAVDFIKGKPRL